MYTFKEGTNVLKLWSLDDFVSVLVPSDEAVVFEFGEVLMIHRSLELLVAIRRCYLSTRRNLFTDGLGIVFEECE